MRFLFVFVSIFLSSAKLFAITPKNSSETPSRFDQIAGKLYQQDNNATIEWMKAPELCSPDCPGSMWFGNPRFLKNQSQEMHIISYNKPAEAKTDKDGRVIPPQALVHIKKADKPVVLLLSSHHGINWKVEAAANVTIAKIYLASSELGNVKAPAGVPIQVLPPGIGDFSRSSINEKKTPPLSGFDFLKQVQSQTGVPAVSYQGNTVARDTQIPIVKNIAWIEKVYDSLEQKRWSETANSVISASKNKDARALALLPVHKNLAASIPADIRQLVWSPADERYYMVSSQELYTMDTNGNISPLQVLAGIVKPTWNGGVAYNARLKRIYFVSTWHSGNHHAYEPLTKKWLTFPISGNSATTVIYLLKTEKLYGVTYPQVIEYDDQLKPQRIWDVSTSPAQLVSSSRVGSSSLDAMYLMVESGENMLLLNESARHSKETDFNREKTAVVFNPMTLKTSASH